MSWTTTKTKKKPNDNLKFRHAGILALKDIRPSPENSKLYRPVDPNDPEVQSLAESIRQYGVKEPLVVTTDGWLLSGHRRHVAARLAGLSEVPCRIDPIRRDTDPDGFVTLLREYNRHRVKSFDEVLREEVVSATESDRETALFDYRQGRAAVEVTQIDLREAKVRARISEAKTPMLEAIERILEERKQFWPLSDRVIHYALLNDPPLRHASKPDSFYANDNKSYDDLTNLLTRARLEGRIPMEAIDDPTRPVTVWPVHADVGSFVRKELNQFLAHYWRDLLWSQPNHIEILVEKNTIASIVEPIAMEYTIPLTSGRGYASLSPRAAMVERFRKSGKDSLVVLILSDFDPDGEEIASSFARSLRDDFEVTNIMPVKVALTAKQVETFNLPPMMKAKTKSSNYKRFADAYGDDVWELEALDPKDLQAILREAIESVLDREAFAHETAREAEDIGRLNALRQRVNRVLSDIEFEQ